MVNVVVVLVELHVEAEVTGVQAGGEHFVKVRAGVLAEGGGDLDALALAGRAAVDDLDGVGGPAELVPGLLVEMLEVFAERHVFGAKGGHSDERHAERYEQQPGSEAHGGRF